MMEYSYLHRVHALDKATGIADWLINYYNIQLGYGLSKYLGVHPTYQNHEATRLWVHSQMIVLPKRYKTLGELRKAFESLLPSEAFG